MQLYGDDAGWYYFVNDHLGTPQKVVDNSGSVVWEAGYLPFGEARLLVADIDNNLRFPGQFYDVETGLHYNWHRYYDPETGRYWSVDPIGLEGGINLYAYADVNPVNWFDSKGLDPGEKFSSLEEAAIDAVKYINKRSVTEGIEYGGWIQKNDDNTFSYDPPVSGTALRVPLPEKKENHKGWYHTHGSSSGTYGDETFSSMDKNVSLFNNVPGWLGTPSGKILRYNHHTYPSIKVVGKCPN